MTNNFGTTKRSLWTSLKEFRLFKWIQQVVNDLWKFIETRNGFFWFFFILLSSSSLGIWLNSTWLICLTGFCWVSVGFVLFVISTNTKKFFDELALREGFTPIWVFLFKLASNLTYTLGGIVIAITNLLLELHVNAANEKLVSFFQLKEITWQTLVFGVGAPIVGFLMDIKGLITQQKKGGQGVILLASLQLYVGLITLFTGFFGGITAIKALSTLLSAPYLLITSELGGISPALSLDICKSMGIIPFVFFYLCVPVSIMAQSKAEVRNILDGKETVLPKLSLLSLFYSSFLFLAIMVLVGFYQGWIQTIFYYILWLLKVIWDWVAGFFQ